MSVKIYIYIYEYTHTHTHTHTHNIFFIHSLAAGYLGYFHILATVNNTALNSGLHVLF